MMLAQQIAIAGEAESRVPVSHLLEVFQAELSELAGLADGVQDAVAEIALGAPGARDGFITEAQSLDLIVQRLRSLATFMRLVAPGMELGWTVDPSTAARSLTLARLTDRLISPTDLVVASEEASGDFQLF